MDFEKFLIVLVLFAFIAILFPTLVTEIGGISPADPLKWLFDFIPYALIGSFIFIVAIWGTHRE